MSVSDAVILLIGDGLVAVGRVLGGLRARCAAEKHADTLAEAEESRDSWGPDELAWAPTLQCPNIGGICNCTGACRPDGVALKGLYRWESVIDPAQDRSAAVSTPAADNTPDHLEAAYNYHRPAANYNGDLVWGCEGCGWGGPTIQAHSRHRFQVLADMKNATTRVQEQLGGAS